MVNQLPLIFLLLTGYYMNQVLGEEDGWRDVLSKDGDKPMTTEERVAENEKAILVMTETITILRSEIESLKTCAQCEETAGYHFKPPSFMSDWIEMKSQDFNSRHGIVVEHGLSGIPYKVDVLVEAIDGPNEGWKFHADSTLQISGIMYYYNETHVKMFAPFPTAPINTGANENSKIGSNHQISEKSMVRFKAWSAEDMPPVSFKSDWLPLDVKNSSTSFYELFHGFNDYPALVNVQIRMTGAFGTLIFEGVGSTLLFQEYITGGSVAWAHSNNSVRIWSAYVADQSDPKWEAEASVRVLAWSQKIVKSDQDFFVGKSDIGQDQFGLVHNEITDVDIFSIYTEALSGPNEGFRFQGYAAAHSRRPDKCGTVFAYISTGQVRAWNLGFYINIQTPYGDGHYTQSSNDAAFVGTLLKTRPSL